MKRKYLKDMLAFVLATAFVFSPQTLLPASAAVSDKTSVVSRDDGVWLFPLNKAYYNSFSDWAGCPGHDACPFHGVRHTVWEDDYHSGQGGHNGIDIDVPIGEAVYASAAGTVYWQGAANGGRGNTVIVEHSLDNGNSYYSYYQHLSKVNIVSNGSAVSAGTKIAESGNSGIGSGAHLHFGIVLGKSSQGKAITDGNAFLAGLENKGWLKTEAETEGRILNNPATTNDAGFPTGYATPYDVVSPLKAHCGSVHYTFSADKVNAFAETTPAQDADINQSAKSPLPPRTVAVGQFHTLAIKSDGSLWSWTHFSSDAAGYRDSNMEGQLGDGTTTPHSTPAKIMDNAAAVYTRRTHSMALKSDGSLWEWGEYTPSLGFPPEPGTHNTPVKVMDDVVDMLDPYQSMGNVLGFSAALKKDGSLWLWGHGEAAWKREARIAPYKVLDGVSQIYNDFALQSNGTLWRFYAEYDYTANKPIYGYAKAADNVDHIVAGHDVAESLIIKKDSSLWVLSYGISDKNTDCKKILDNVAYAAKDGWALTKDGGLFVWGDGYTTYRPGDDKPDKPIRICDNVLSFTSALGSVTANMRDGTQKTWGYYSSLVGNYDGIFIVNGIDPYYNSVHIGVFRDWDSSGSSIVITQEALPLLYDDTLGYYYHDDETNAPVRVTTVNVNDISYQVRGINNNYIVDKKGNLLFNGTDKILDSIMLLNEPAIVSPQSALSDKPSSWAEADVSRAISSGLVPQSLQSKYTQAATRSEFCVLAVAVYESTTGMVITKRKTFDDTSDVNVEKMAAIGVVSGTGNNKFSPDAQLTREQAAVMLARLAEALGKPLPEQKAAFADNNSVSSWALEGVGSVQAAGIMSGTGENKFSPQSPYTREQSIVTVLRLFDTIA